VFAVNEFIDQFFSQQKPEAAWPQTLRFANGNVVGRILFLAAREAPHEST